MISRSAGAELAEGGAYALFGQAGESFLAALSADEPLHGGEESGGLGLAIQHGGCSLRGRFGTGTAGFPRPNSGRSYHRRTRLDPREEPAFGRAISCL
jgi:hypothetical protein